jgi:hypothetical protein
VVSRARIQSVLREVLHLRESTHRTALAFALGVFITFSPPYGFHMAIVVFCSWAFGLNFLALMAGMMVNNPWTLVPTIGLTFWIGMRLLGLPDPPPFDWNDLSFMAIYQQVMPYAVPFLLGATVLSVAAALVSYPAAYYFIDRYRRIRRPDRDPPLPPSNPVG